MAAKFIITTILLSIACACFGLSIGLNWATINNNTKVTVSYFVTCVGDNCRNSKDQTTCGELKSGIDAGRAFSILSVVFAGAMSFILGWRMGDDEPTKIPPLVKYGLLVATFLFSVLNWIVGFALFGASFCNSKVMDQTNAKVGPSAPLAFVGSVIVLLVIIVECVMADPEAGSCESAPDNKENKASEEENNNNTGDKKDASAAEPVEQ